MATDAAGRGRAILAWGVLGLAICVPIIAAAASPLLEWRGPVYIAAGFAGIAGLALMLAQPLLVGGYLPGLPRTRGRRVHRVVGGGVLTAVLLHVAGLWITSPPDVIDALLFTSATAFSAWGVIAMWAVIASGLLAVMRRRIRPRTWRIVHTGLALVIVAGTVVHALLIDGTMETVSKVALCVLVVLATARVVTDLRVWTVLTRRRA